MGLLLGPGTDFVSVDEGRTPAGEGDPAGDSDFERAHSGTEGDVPRLHRGIAPYDLVVGDLGHELFARPEPRPGVERRRGHVVLPLAHVGEAELVQHVATDAVGAEHDGILPTGAGRA